MSYFYDGESKQLTRLMVLKDLVSEHPIRTDPCPLLMTQLNELEVLLTKLQEQVRLMQKVTQGVMQRSKE
jgi:hypothetical protein